MIERACTRRTSAHAKTMYLLTPSANPKEISQIDKRRQQPNILLHKLWPSSFKKDYSHQ